MDKYIEIYVVNQVIKNTHETRHTKLKFTYHYSKAEQSKFITILFTRIQILCLYLCQNLNMMKTKKVTGKKKMMMMNSHSDGGDSDCNGNYYDSNENSHSNFDYSKWHTVVAVGTVAAADNSSTATATTASTMKVCLLDFVEWLS